MTVASLPPGAKVTWPTRPWMTTAGTPGPGRWPALYAHAPSFLTDDPGAPFALCSNTRFLTTARPDLPPCPACIGVLTGHGLWPLDLAAPPVSC